MGEYECWNCNEIFELEKKYDFLDNKLSPSKNVGFKPSKNFLKSKHRVQMLSLSNLSLIHI